MTRSKPKRKRAAKVAKVAKPATVLVLRTCDALMRSHGGFVWPESGPVECKDWKPVAECGNGLHGLLWGEGDGKLLNWDESAKWLVVEVAAADVVEIDKLKCKFPRGVVVFCGKGDAAAAYLQARAPAGKIIVWGTATAGYGGEIRIRWWEPKTERYRCAVGYVGEDGVVAGVAHCVRDGKIVAVSP